MLFNSNGSLSSGVHEPCFCKNDSFVPDPNVLTLNTAQQLGAVRLVEPPPRQIRILPPESIADSPNNLISVYKVPKHSL